MTWPRSNNRHRRHDNFQMLSSAILSRSLRVSSFRAYLFVSKMIFWFCRRLRFFKGFFLRFDSSSKTLGSLSRVFQNDFRQILSRWFQRCSDTIFFVFWINFLSFFANLQSRRQFCPKFWTQVFVFCIARLPSDFQKVLKHLLVSPTLLATYENVKEESGKMKYE